MGAKQAKPNPPKDNSAKADADLATVGLQAMVNLFFSNLRLGTSDEKGLGYKLADQKLISQEYKIVVKDDQNVTSQNVSGAIDALFGQDWKALTTCAVNAALPFLGGDTPVPSETAVNSEWSKSFLAYESKNVVQYSVFIRKTNAKSVGTSLQNKETTLLVCVAKGYVDYASIDPQIVMGILSEAAANEEEFAKLVEDIKKALKAAAEIAKVKKALSASDGVYPPIPTPVTPVTPVTPPLMFAAAGIATPPTVLNETKVFESRLASLHLLEDTLHKSGVKGLQQYLKDPRVQPKEDKVSGAAFSAAAALAEAITAGASSAELTTVEHVEKGVKRKRKSKK